MPVGEVNVRLNLNKDGYSAGMTAARQQAQAFGRTIEETGHKTVSQMQASSAAIRVIEGNMTNNIRAAERFISTIPGVGRALQAAFPVVGALAFAGVVGEVARRVYEFAHTLEQARNVANESFSKLTDGAQKNADSLRVTNDKLEQEIAALEHKPINNLALALDEARVRADELASSLNNDYEQFKKIIEESQKGIFSTLLNQGVDKQLGGSMQDQLANIRTLARMQREELKKGNQEAADDLGQKLRAAQDAARSFADSETSKRTGKTNVGTVRESSYAGVYGDQGTNLDAIGHFKDLVSDQEDVADQQKRNTAGEAVKAKLEAAKALAAAQQKGQELIVQQWHKDFDEARSENDMSLAQDAQFWVQRMETARKGSLSYAAALDETNKLIAEMRGQNMRAGKEFDATSAHSYLPGSMDLSKGDTSAEQAQGRAAAGYLKNLNQGIALQHANRDAIAEAAIAMGVMTGTMSKLAAAQALAALHAKEYKDQIDAIDAALANAANLPDGFDKQATIQGLKNQRGQASTGYQIQSAQDQQGIGDNTIPGAVRTSLNQMVQSFTDMAANLKQLIPRSIESLNSDIVKAATGEGSKRDFGQTLKQTGQGLLGIGLQGAEGAVMKKLGFGKADGSKENPFYTIAAAGMGAGAGIDLSSPARTAMVGLKDLVPGTSFIQPFISALPHFAAGGNFMPDRPLMVGERGPEILSPGFSGHITPNSAIGGSTGHTFNIDARGSNDPEAVRAAIMRAGPSLIAASVQAVHHANKRAPSR